MTIQEMLEREDIYTILSETLEEYFRTVYDKDVSFKVEKSLFKNRYVIYPRLGIVSARFPSWKVAKDIYTQFNVQGNWKRKFFAWGYITLCFLTGGLMASRSLYVSDKKWCKRDRYILPCNRKIRIFDYGKGYVDAILKVGFNDTYFQNELKYRAKPEYGFIPPFKEYGNRWYREAILSGRALVRIGEPAYSEAVENTKKEIYKLYEKTLHHEDIISYSNRLVDSIQKKLPLLVKKKGMSVKYVNDVLDKCQKYVNGSNIKVPLVISHGDLQTGNIMVGKSGEITIYDWETAGERSIWFDMGKLLLYSQRKGGYAHMIDNRDNEDVCSKLMSLDNKKYPMTNVIAVLVLEEMEFFVDEIIDLPETMGVEIMDRLTDELKETALFRE